MLITTPTNSDMNLSGLGACPDYAPYTNEYGRCTNVAPASSGSSSAPASSVPSSQSSPSSTSGMIVSNRAQAEAQAAAAVAAGRARGLDVQCQLILNEGTPGYDGLWTTDCRWPGAVDSHDAGLLIQPRGFDIAMNEEHAAATGGRPIIQQSWLPVLQFSNPVPTVPAAPASQAQASTATNRPNQSVPPRDTSVPMPTGIPNTGASFAEAAQSGLATISAQTGIGSGGLLVLAAVAVYFMVKK